jgi:16S rRNA (guanine527-N7)-methyltransferase
MASGNFSYDDFIPYINVSRETFLRLESYANLLEKWQKKINLISPSTVSNIWVRHIIDSAQLVEHVSENDVIADIGSGAGFPGLVLAVMGIKNMALIESDTRKVAFLKEAARVTKTNITVLNQRVESVSLSGFSLITARGFAPLKELLDSLKSTLTDRHNILLLKGKHYKSEIETARKSWSFDYEAFPSITEREGVILSIRNPAQGARVP